MPIRRTRNLNLVPCKMEAALDTDAVGAALNIASINRDRQAVAARRCDEIGKLVCPIVQVW